MRKFLFGLLLALVCSAGASAQTLCQWRDTLTNSIGQVIPGATVIILSGTIGGTAAVNTNTQPGTPLATIYADPYGLVPINQTTNPINTASGDGTFQFWGTCGAYLVIQGYGPQIAGQYVYSIRLSGSSTGGAPGGNTSQLQFNSAGTFGGAQGITTSNGSNLTIKGPAPWVDINATGGRAVSAPISTTASCNGTTTVAVGSNAGFQQGDGVVIYGCGATNALSTPSAPTVAPGVTQTLTVPDAVMVSDTSGATSYSYKIVNRDKFGGLTLPSGVTTIANGPATLGENQLTITSTSITGNTMTVTMSAPEGLKAGELVHILNASSEAIHGWFQISSISSNTIFVVNNITLYYSSTITISGGTLTYYTGNQISWSISGANPWETIICASRPADSGAYHVIGLSYPFNTTVAYGSNTLYTDWGSVLSSKPQLPPYITDSICTAGSATNDYLSTTITNISGTTITVANTASQTISGQTFLFDDAPAIKAAFVSATTNPNYTSVVYLPWSSAGVYYYVNSFLDLSAYSNPLVAMHQEGILWLNETMIPPRYWYGNTSQQTQTGGVGGPIAIDATAWPGVYDTQAFPLIQGIQISASGNQELPLMLDGGANIEGGTLDHLVLTTGSTADYSGTGLTIRPGFFNFSIHDIVFTNGPGNGSMFPDSTWTPMMYFARDTSLASGESSLLDWEVYNIKFNVGRTFYDIAGAGGSAHISNVYTQGNLLPGITMQEVIGVDGSYIKIDGVLVNDTSGEPYVGIIGSGESRLNLELSGAEGLSTNGAAGVGPQVSGQAPGSLFGKFNSGMLVGKAYEPQPSFYANAVQIERLFTYANDYFDTGNFNSTRVIERHSNPVLSQSSFLVPLDVPILSTPTASAGGSIPDGAHTYCLSAVGFNGGWSKSSCQSFTVVGSNQTLTFNWTAVTGAKGYVISQDNNNCLPSGNANCSGLTTVAGVTTLVYSSAGSNTVNVATMNAAGDGISGFNANGSFGPKFACPEKTAPSGVANFDLLYCDSTSHSINEINGSGSASPLVTNATLDGGALPVAATTVTASGIVDGQTHTVVTTSASPSLADGYSKTIANNQEATSGAAVTYTLPAAVAGLTKCVINSNNGSAADTGVLTLQTSASGQYIIFTDGTLSASGGYVSSGGAAADNACVQGVDATHWQLFVQSGTWAKH